MGQHPPVTVQSLRTRALKLVLLTFGGLTVFIAAALVVRLNIILEGDLEGRAQVIARALEQSVDITVGARQHNEKQLQRGLGWLTSVGEELALVVVLTPDGTPIAGVGPEGILDAAALLERAEQRPGFMEVAHTGTLAAITAPGAVDDLEAALSAESDVGKATATRDPRVRIMLTGQAQLVRQVSAVFFTGLTLGIIAFVALWWIARDSFRLVEPVLEQARRMSQGDFSSQLRDGGFQELSAMYTAMNGATRSMSGMIGEVRSLGDELNSAVDRIMGAAAGLRAGADQGTNAMAVTEGAVSAMQRSVELNNRFLTDLAATADASSRDTETIERTNASTGETVLTLRGEVERHAKSLSAIAERTKLLSRDARALGDASEAARAAALRMKQTSQDGSARANEAARLATDAVRDTQVGGKAIEDAVARIQEIAAYAGTMEGSLRGLTERVQGMTPVLGAIADVTSRTSLLALNAGIIAAQAGERGAAFQVVVDELKALAARTAQLTSSVEQSVHTVLEQRGRTEEAAQALRRVVGASIEDAHRAGTALDAIRSSTTQSQQVSAGIAQALVGQERDVRETLERIDVVDGTGRSVEATARGLDEEVRVLKEVADRVSAVSDDVAFGSREQGELAARVGQVLALVARQVRELVATQAATHADVMRVERSIGELRRFAEDARAGAAELEGITERVRAKASGLADALHRFRTG